MTDGYNHKTIRVVPRYILEHTFYSPEEPWIVISVTEPNEPMVIIDTLIETQPKEILRLVFHDVVPRLENLNDKVYLEKYKCFTEEHAKAIWDFVDRHYDINYILCQCRAGISRSAGIAAALAKVFNDDDWEFFHRYMPNSLVYGTLIRHYFGRSTL